MAPQTTERWLLQMAIAIAGLVPVLGGLAGIILGPSAFDPAVVGSIALDSHVRYLSGLLLGIGVTFWCLISTIERQTTLVRVLTAIVVLGGLARLIGAVSVGWPSGAMTFALSMELIVAPLLCLWQARIAQLARSS